MEEVFVLKQTRPYKRSVRVFIKNKLGKITSVNCMFTTEHLVDATERSTNARLKPAEFATNNPELIEAMLCDSSYGKDFVLKRDPEGKLKKKTLVLSREDVDIAALQSLYQDAGMKFDPSKSFLELKMAYNIHMEAMSGRRIELSKPAEIPIKIVDVAAEIGNQKALAMENYEIKYGEPVPDIVAGDVAFLDAMLNVDFDAEAYIKAKIEKAAEAAKQPVQEETFETLDAKYMEKFKTHIPTNKKNDFGWVKNKLNS